MKTIIILTLLLCWQDQSVAQITPMFQTDIYFEDAKGNKDTITIGFDTLAAGSMLNPDFGELDITTPFDSIFEVRAAHLYDFGWGNQPYALSKKIIGFAENAINNTSCYGGTPVLLLIHVKHQPVTISWDQSIFSNSCLRPSFLTPDRMYQMINPWDWFDMPAIRYGCTSKMNTLTTFLGKQYKSPMEIPYIAKKAVKGSLNMVDSIYGISFIFSDDWPFSPCSLVSASEASAVFDNQAEIFPSPAIDEINVRNKDKAVAITTSVYDQNGRAISHVRNNHDGSEQQFDIQHFSAGVYYIVQRMKHGEIRVNKWVKM